ncbi:putative Amino acid adenylation domain-containing protein [Seiridium unicorne]|uniref:Amino acid adenylation domain-containing protein n=1 Tax=Seiridium unicorne TaxID=138068 RepID=A0ABR2UKV3_9PEZI
MGGPDETTGLSILNPTPTKLPGPDLLHNLVTKPANQNVPAIDFLGENGKRSTTSYTELDALSDRLANRISQVLHTQPAGQTTDKLIVPLMIPQSPDLYIALIAVLKAGAAFCPLNLDVPTDRLKFILGDVNAGLVLTTSALVQRIKAANSDANVICVDEKDTTSMVIVESGVTNGFRNRIPAAHDLAYVMYTSGSTGTPKGVGISHLAVTQSLLAHNRHIPEFYRFLQFAAPTFDVSVFEIFFPLFRGSTLICCNRIDMLTDLPRVIREMDVDACELTPSVAGSLLKHRTAAPKLKLILTIGEMLTKPVVSEFGGNAQTPSILWGMYGPTEAAIHCTMQTAFMTETSPNCIGIPLDTVSAFVIKISEDETDPGNFDIVPAGQVGELAIGGHQLATGYLNRTEQTAASFIKTDYGRIYKTGDKARMLPNGSIECMGRVSEGQVKLNGQRMELGEVEHVILRTVGCHSAYVCVISNVLVAFAAVENLLGMQDKVTASCKRWLPSFMVPTEVIVTVTFPRLPSGKIDRMRLKEEYLSSHSVEPQANGELRFEDELERTLYTVAQDVLQTSVQAKTRLSSLGLDSLSAIHLAARLRDQEFSISALDILDSETLDDLYKLMRSRENEPDRLRLPVNGSQDLISVTPLTSMYRDLGPDVKLEDVKAITQCTSLQISMLAETFRDPQLYVNTVDIRLPRNTSTSAFKSWVSEVARRNDILQTGFLHSNDELVQVIWKHLLDSQIVVVDEFLEAKFDDVGDFLQHPFQVEIHRSRLVARIIIHHALYDGWTIDLLLDDLATLAQGKTLPERPSFRDIARYLDGSPGAKGNTNEFWAEHLQNIAGASLPNFKTTAVLHPTIESASWPLHIDPHTVQQTAIGNGVTPQAIFEASLLWLWGAIIGSEDVTIGSVFSGRTLPIAGIEQAMGPCLSTFPIRARLGEFSTILDLVKNVHSTNRQILHLNPMSLADIKKAAGIPHGSKLFDVLFVYQESLSSRKRGTNIIGEIGHRDHIESKLLLEVEPHEDDFSCKWTYHSDTFSLLQVQSFAEHFSHLCSYFFQQMHSPVGSIATSFPTGSLSRYAPPSKQLQICSSLSDHVEERSITMPDAEALCFAHSITATSAQTESLTYKQLNESANQIARHLTITGASQGGVVAIIMEKSPLLYCGILGILKAGCAYLPLLPSTPAKRVRLILEQAKPQLCIVEDLSSWKKYHLPCTLTNLHISQYEQHSTSNLDIAQDQSRLAYVIFTSGTTGTPKGVSVTTKNMLSNIAALSSIYPLEGSTRMLQACSQAFDVSVFEIFFAWANGMCLCAATNDNLFEDLERSIRNLQVTHLSMTVTVASLINPKNVPQVSFLVTSGEPMTDEVLNKWNKFLYQGYGPSETTNICTVRKVYPGDSSQYLGWSLDNTTSFVFCPNANDLVPICCAGELCFGGDQVAAGYLNMPELTSEKFFDHPEYGRLYRSGDRGRMLPDGSIIIMGRLDTQIKLRGQRIEVREMESLILSSGIARSCACLLLENEYVRSQQLFLFYVPTSEDNHIFDYLPLVDKRRQEIFALFQTLEDSLPGYMVPSFILPITCLPLTSSGKTNTDRLRQSAASLPLNVLNQFSLPTGLEDQKTDWSETEKHILDAVATTLSANRKTISRWTSFAALGLDSLSAIPLSRKLQINFGRKIPISQILQNPNISRLAYSIMSTTPRLTNDAVENQFSIDLLPKEVIEIVRQRLAEKNRYIGTLLPCTPLQTAMLASTMSSNENLRYRNQMLFRINNSPEEFILYWNRMRLRHDILRTCFVSTDDAQHPIVQVVLKHEDFSWSRFHAVDIERCAMKHLECLPVPVDSLQPPIALAIMTTLDGNFLSFVCHHALYDGVAIGTLLSEIESLARGEVLRAAPSFRPFLHEALTLPTDTDSYWLDIFRDFHPSYLPQDHVLSNGVNESNSTNGALLVHLDHSLLPLSSIQAKVRETGVSLLSLCQAAWAETLSTVLKTSDVCFGNVFSGRSMPLDDINDLVAPCFNTIPFRVKLGDLKSNRGVMKACQTLTARMLQYQFTPLRRIRSLIEADNISLFDTLLLVQPPAKPLDQDIWTLEFDTGFMDVPIVCEVTPNPETDELNISIHRDNDLLPTSLGKLLRDVFNQALMFCLTYPSSQLNLEQKLPAHLQSLVKQISPAEYSNRNVMDDETESFEAQEPWSTHEEQVRQVIAKFSNVTPNMIGKHTSIYRLGLDSINIIQAASLLRQEGLQISPMDILENPTCAGIASKVPTTQFYSTETQPRYDLVSFQRSIRQQVGDANLPFEPEAILPCTPLQQGMISQFILSEGANYYNFVSWSLNLAVDCDRLRDAWGFLQKRHQILRSGFVSINHTDTSVAMVTYRPNHVSPPVKYLKGHSGNQFDLVRWRQGCATEAFKDLIYPPWQVVLLDQDDSKSMHLGMHHALYDAASLQQMLQELRNILNGEELGPPNPIEVVVASILGQTTEVERDTEAFWKETSTGMVVNSFPTLTPLRVDIKERQRISRTSRAPLHDMRNNAASAGVTMQAALQSAWTRVLSSYQGDCGVTFGVVLSGRTNNLENFVFPCITTLPVVAQNAESNRRLLNSMMDYNTALRRHEHTSLNRIQRWTGHAESPIFDTILVYQRGSLAEGVFEPWQITDEKATVDYPISLEIEEVGSDSLRFSLDFHNDILPPDQADLLLSQFDANLIELLQSPNGQENDMIPKQPDLYSVMPPQYSHLPCGTGLLHQFVEATANSSPNNVALEFVHALGEDIQSMQWSYRQLDELGNKIAHLLLDHGIQRGGIVAVCFDKCPEAYFTILGILKAGCAFVALDPGAPASRQQFIVEDSGALALMLKTGWTIDLEFSPSCPVLHIDIDNLGPYPEVSPVLDIDPQDNCYCLYTSGTTGTPKGCLITHENAVQAMLAFQRLFAGHWDDQSRWLQFASFHFDVSVLEQYWSWSVGIRVISASRDLILSDLLSTISRLEITHIDLTPSLARLVHPDEVPSLCKGVFITGGEQLRQDILDVWGSKGVIYNAYGPTEATIGVTMYCRVPQNGRSSNIGKQFPNVGSYVLRPGSDVPVIKGGIGELCVSGKLVGRGYLNRADLTAERFPVLDRFDERVYRTGDLVRVLHDGCFDFLGRADDQVKLRGQRLEIGEINHAIKAGLREVADVATLVTKHQESDRDVMVSFIVTKASNDSKRTLVILSDNMSLSLGVQAQDACRAKLPGYMVPTYVLCVPHIPLSANNKAQTSILKQLFNSTSPSELRNLSAGSTNGSAKLSALEPELTRIIATVAKVNTDEILSSTTIFELGIDSISVIELARRLRAAGFFGVAPSAILQNSRLSALAKALKGKSSASENNQVLRTRQTISACYHRHLPAACRRFRVKQADIEYVAPCTGLQEGMLSRSSTSEGRATYFNSFQIELVPRISISRLKAAWERLVDENAILRTSFMQTVDGYVQVAFKKPPFNWHNVELEEGEVKKHLEQQFTAWIQGNEEGVRKPLELECMQMGNRHVLLVRIFHGIYDARSFDLILQKAEALYNQESLAKGPVFIDTLPHGPLCDHSSSKSFWQDLFSGFSYEPTRSLISNISKQDATVSRSFDVGCLEARRVQEGVTQQTMVQVAWISVLAHFFKSWPSIGIVLSGRSLLLDGIENTIGPLFNTLAFRVKNSAIASWSMLIQETHRFNASVLSFAHVPLHQVQKWCSNGQPLFDNLFTFNREDISSSNGHSTVWGDISSESTADYPLAFEGTITSNNQLKVVLVSQSHIADESALRLLLDGVQQAISGIVSDEGFPVHCSAEITSDSNPDRLNHSNGSSARNQRVDGDFVWTDQALHIQGEIAALAGASSDQVLEDTTIFELGLDSIDAVKLVTRLRRFGISLMTSELMKHPTIRDILSFDTSNRETTDGESLPSQALETQEVRLRHYLEGTDFDVNHINTTLPPTPLQDSMVAEMVASGFQRYFNHDILEISSGVKLDTLKFAIEAVVENSPILRTSFVLLDDPKFSHAYCQVVATELDPFEEEVTLDSLQDMDRIVENARMAAARSEGRSKLLQFRPVSVSGRRYIILSIAHALYDGTSLDLLHQDIQAAYDGAYHARQSYKPTLANILASSSDAAESFWAEFLYDTHATVLPKTVGQDQFQASLIHKLEVLSQYSVSQIKACCMRQRITTQALGQACWTIVLGTLVQSLSVTFGVVLSGRSTEEEQNLMFPTMNTVPVRTILHGSITEYLQYIWDNLNALREFQYFPLRKAQKLSGGSSGPLFNTLFTMQSRAETSSDEFVSIWKSIQSASEIDYPLCVEMEIIHDQLVWRVACDDQYISKEQGQTILGQLDQVLGYFLTNEYGQVVDFSSSGGSVSICGLPPFKLESENNSHRDDTVDEDGDFETKWTETESQMVDVLAEVSGVERSSILPSQSIYHLGLDSISAIKASSLLRKRGVIVSVRDMVSAASIRDIAPRDKETQPGKEIIFSPITERRDPLKNFDLDNLIAQAGFDQTHVEKILPALPMQVHMLSVWDNTGGEVYFYEFSYEILGDVLQNRIVDAWHTLLAELPILRTCFVATGAFEIPFVQVVVSPDQSSTKHSGDATSEWELQLQGSRLFVVRITKAAGETATLRVRIHHALYDGVSLPMIVSRFSALCGSRQPPAPAGPESWYDFVLAHNRENSREQSKGFWERYLQGATSERSRTAASDVHSRTSLFRPSVISDLTRIRTKAAESGISIQALFFAAYAKHLSALNDTIVQFQDRYDIVFGIYLANRTSFNEALRDAPYPTLSIVPLRVLFHRDDGLVEIAMRVQSDLLEIGSFENASAGLWEIAEWTGVKIASFVNFLTLPDTTSVQDADEEIRFQEKTAMLPQESKGQIPADDLARPDSPWLSGNRAKHVYIDAVDIEAAMRGNSMDIGIFGASSLLSRIQASDLIGRIVGILDKV